MPSTKASIKFAFEQIDGAMEAGGDVRGRDAEAASCLGGGEVLVVAQFADVSVGGGQRGNYFAKQGEHLPLLSQRLGILGEIYDEGTGLIGRPLAFATEVQCAVADNMLRFLRAYLLADRAMPWTSPVRIGMRPCSGSTSPFSRSASAMQAASRKRETAANRKKR